MVMPTHFFHVQAKIIRARQHVVTLKDESEEWIQGSDLHNHVNTHFQHLFQSGSQISNLPPPETFFSSSDFNQQELYDMLVCFLDIEEI